MYVVFLLITKYLTHKMEILKQPTFGKHGHILASGIHKVLIIIRSMDIDNCALLANMLAHKNQLHTSFPKSELPDVFGNFRSSMVGSFCKEVNKYYKLVLPIPKDCC